MRQEPVHDLDRLVGVVDGDVHVHAEDQLPPRDVLELVDQGVVAVVRRDALALEQAERVRASRADAQPVVAPDVPHVAAQGRQLAQHVARVRADRRRDLEDGLHQLGVDPIGERVALDRVEHRLDVLDEVEALRVEEHVLLLDAERVRVAGAEAVVDDARRGRGPSPVIEAGTTCFRGAPPRFDLDQPASVEESHDDGGRSRTRIGENVAVRPGDLVQVGRARGVDLRPHYVLEPRARALERLPDDLEAQRACSYASPGGGRRRP